MVAHTGLTHIAPPTVNDVLGIGKILEIEPVSVDPLYDLYQHIYEESETISKQKIDFTTLISTHLKKSLARFDFTELLPKNIHSAIKLLSFSDIEIMQLRLTLDRIHCMLSEKNIKHELETDTFVDPEYSNWVQIKLIIKLKEDFDSLYKEVKSQVYDEIKSRFSDSLYEKVIIKLQPA